MTTAVDLQETLGLVETTPLAEAVSERPSPGRILIRVIEGDRWGTSGFYSRKMLERDGPKAFKAQTLMFINHPTATQDVERPERDVRDIAGRLTSDAKYMKDGLYAEAEVFPHYRDLIEGLADVIGVSIRARGIAETGEAQGRTGPLITSIDEAASVDFVTAAGAGGRVMQFLESARTAREGATEVADNEAPGLSEIDQVRAALQEAERERDAERVRADAAEARLTEVADPALPDTPGGPASEPESSTEPDPAAGDEPDSTTTPTDAAEGAAATPPPIQEDHMTDTPGAGATAPPSSPREVLEAGQVQLRRQVAELQARDRARTIIAESLADAWLTNSTVARLSTELLEGLPIVNDTLDEAALRDRIVAKRNVAETEAAEMLQAAGVGTPRGLGESANGSGIGVDPAVFEAEFAEVFQNLGMSETAAKHAAKGR